MTNLQNEILSISEIAACIALDSFELLEKKIKAYKNQKNPPLKLYECILQSYLFCGFPSAIESLRIFRKYYPEFKIAKRQYKLSEFKKAGKNNCKLIYKKNYKKLIENMEILSPDLKEWMIVEGYGKVLGRKGLSLIERELINAAILCSRYFENQLHSHLKGCLHMGASKEDLILMIKNLSHVIDKANINKAVMLINKL